MRSPRAHRAPWPWPLIVAVVTAGACGDGATEPEPRTIEQNPSFAADIQEIFERRGCDAAGCHGNQPFRANLDLTRGQSYAELVGVQAFMEPSFQRVVPGSPAASYLLVKLQGSQSEGDRMPRGAAPLDEIDMGNITNWIANGAPNN